MKDGGSSRLLTGGTFRSVGLRAMFKRHPISPIVVDLNTMKVLATHPVGEDPDVLAFDPGLKRLYASAESGNVFVFREDGKALVQEGDISIPHAHTVCVDPNTHLVYFPLENIDGHALLRIMEPPTTQ